jgi:TPR repeat protein
MKGENDFAMVRKPSSAVEKAAPGAKRVLAGMVAETIALAESRSLIKFDPNASPLLEAWFQKGKNYFEGKNVPVDNVEAEKWIRKAAEKGHAKAQNWLGLLYQCGRGVPHDTVEAAKWYRKAAEQGDESGLYNMGNFYYHGWGDIPQNKAEAEIWYQKAKEKRAKAHANM